MGYTALDFRYFCLNAHYRKKLNFTFEGLDAAKKSYERLLGALYQHKTSPKSTDEEKLARYKKEFEDAINDDLNIPMALGVLWKMVREEKSKDIYKLALDMDKVFGLSLDKAKAVESDEAESDIPDEVTALVNERSEAKKAKNYALADEIRAKISALGYAVTDTKDGVKITKA